MNATTQKYTEEELKGFYNLPDDRPGLNHLNTKTLSYFQFMVEPLYQLLKSLEKTEPEKSHSLSKPHPPGDFIKAIQDLHTLWIEESLRCDSERGQRLLPINATRQALENPIRKIEKSLLYYLSNDPDQRSKQCMNILFFGHRCMKKFIEIESKNQSGK